MRLLIHDYAGHPFQIQLSRELAKRGHDVTHAYASGLLTPTGNMCKSDDDSESLKFLPVRISKYYKKYKYNFFARIIIEYFYGKNLRKLLESNKYDVVVSGNTPSEPQFNLLKICKNTNSKFVYWIQDFYGIAVLKLLEKKIPVFGSWIGGLYKRYDDYCLKNSDGIVCITEDFLPLVKACGGNIDKTIVIPNWSNIHEILRLEKDNFWSREHRLNEKFNFVYTGTLAMKHNPERIVELAKSFKDNDEVRVIVVSEGPGAEYLKKCINSFQLSNLIILPFQDISVIPQVLATSDVLIVLLEPDAGVFSVPSKILSYLCSGRPILGSIPKENLAGKILQNEIVGYCVDPENSSDFIEKAKILLASDKEKLEYFGSNGRKYAEKYFIIEKIADKFESFFNRI